MGDVKRYDVQCVGCCDMAEARAVVDSHGEYVEHPDYARLERERDHYKAFHDETMPVLEAAQGLRNRLDAAERAMAAQAAELTRLRAVEKAAGVAIEGARVARDVNGSRIYIVKAQDIKALAEACGRKGP